MEKGPDAESKRRPDAGEPLVAGVWQYRPCEDGTAAIVGWLGDVYDMGGVTIEVPESIDGHAVSGLEGDPFGADRIAGMVDDGWLPPVTIVSAPDSPVRTWCATHGSDYLYWCPPDDGQESCAFTVLEDGTVRIDLWWSLGPELRLPAKVDGHDVSTLGTGCCSYAQFERVVVPEGIITIGSHAFYKCFDLVEASLPSTLREVGNHAFAGCSLARADLPREVRSIGGHAFAECEFESIVLPEGLRHLGPGAFCDCAELKSVTLPNRLAAIEPYTFESCSSLRSVVVPDGVTSIGSLAFAFSGVTSVSLPASVEHIEDHAFVGGKADIAVEAPAGSYASRWCETHRTLIGASLLDLI